LGELKCQSKALGNEPTKQVLSSNDNDTPKAMEMTMIGQWKGVAETVQNNWKCRAAGCKDKMEGPQLLKHNELMQKLINDRHTAVKKVDWCQEVVPGGYWQVK